MPKPTRAAMKRKPNKRPLVVLTMKGGNIQAVGTTAPCDVFLVDYDNCEQGDAPDYMNVVRLRGSRDRVVGQLDAAIDVMLPNDEAMDGVENATADTLADRVQALSLIMEAVFRNAR